MTSSGALTTLDLVDGHGRGGGTLGESGASIHFVLAASKVYIRANASSWKTLLSNSAEANLVANKWIEASSSNKDFASLANLLDITKLVQSFVPQGTIHKGAIATFKGQKVIPLYDNTGSPLYVAETGKPYIVGIHNTGQSAGTIAFDEYDSAHIPSAPRGALSLNQLVAGSS
jgi:hypothetical protein